MGRGRGEQVGAEENGEEQGRMGRNEAE